jgi:hypothetical protein
MKAIHTSTHDDSSSTANETSDKITGKTGNEMRQSRTHTYPKLKSLQDLSIRVNPEVTEEVVHHAGLRVNGSLHLCLHMFKVIHPSLKSPDPFHCALSLVNPITDVPLQRSILVRVPGRGGGSSLKARLGVIVRGIVITALMVTRVANPIPCGVIVVCCAASIRGRLRVQGGPAKLWRASPFRSNYSVRLSQEYSRKVGLGNRIALQPYSIDTE